MTKTPPNFAIIIGILLIAVGILSRVLTGTSSITALIPAFFGLPIAALGALALAPLRRRGSVIAICALALLGLIGTYTVFIDLFGTSQGEVMSASTIARTAMFLLCASLLFVCGMALTRGEQA